MIVIFTHHTAGKTVMDPITSQPGESERKTDMPYGYSGTLWELEAKVFPSAVSVKMEKGYLRVDTQDHNVLPEVPSAHHLYYTCLLCWLLQNPVQL